MNNSIHRISLDIHDTGSQVSISAKKGDTARSLHITLTENGKPYRIAEGCYAVFTAIKPDKNYLFNDCTIRDNVIIYDFTEQTVPVVGQVHCEVILYDANNERITSPRFDLVVDGTVYNDEEIVSSDEANALISATAEAKAITAEVEQKLANGDFVGEKGDPFTYEDFTEEQLASLKGDPFTYEDFTEEQIGNLKGKDGKDANPNLFANAVIGSAEGEVVQVDDVSPVEHDIYCQLTSDAIADFSSVKVSRYGKNLLDISSLIGTSITANGGTLSVGEDGGITGSGTPTSGLELPYVFINNPPKNTLTFSRSGEFTNITCIVYVRQEKNNLTSFTLGEFSTQQSKTLNLASYPTADNILFNIKRNNNNQKMSGTIYLQCELGVANTKYEKGVSVETYTPNADGTVEGITSLSPTMTLLTDTEGAVIHCEYNRDTNKALASVQPSGGATVTADGTVVSPNADFAEVAEWADGNPDNEDRTGYFVCANVPLDGIVMKKATSTDDVKGVTILAPAFAGNFTKDKLDAEGNLLPKYSYVAIIGFVPVRDNGTCTVGGRCMPDDNGCAIPSSNSMGYQVVNRIDENRVLIIIEPNGDMVQRVKTKITKLQEDFANKQDKFADVVDFNGGQALEFLEKITLLYRSTADYRGNSYLSLSETLAYLFGSTITLQAIVNANINATEINLHAVNDGTDTNNINVNSNRIRNLAAPIYDTDAVNKQYMDAALGDIESTLDSIIAIQENLMGGDGE